MKTIILLGMFSFLISLTSMAQYSGSIRIEKKGLKRSYIQNDNTLTSKDLGLILSSNPASAREYQASKTNGIIGLASITCGTVFIGVGFYNTLKAAQATNNNDIFAADDYTKKSSADMLIGAGFYVVSLPFILMSGSHLKKSINLYNASGNTGNIDKVDLYVGFTGNGATVQLRF